MMSVSQLPSILIFFAFSVLVLFRTRTEAVIKLPSNVTIPALLVFGDSIVDTGNNNDLVSPAKCNFPPYGRDFKGGVPTGRFSNGKVPSDLIAEELGIKELLPAYRDPKLTPQDLLTGVCFASGGSGYDELTSKTALAISLPKQLGEFKEYVGKLKEMIGEERTSFLLANSVFAIVQGSNDIDNSYFTTRIRASQYSPSGYADLLAQTASDFVKELYEIGARRIAVFGAPPLGCVPTTRTTAGGLQRNCNDDYNKESHLFNSILSKKLDALNRELPQIQAVYVEIYEPLLDLIKNPRAYGFEISDRGCCGTGTFEAALTCNQFSPHTCSDVSKYVFWDGFHPTEKAYRILISRILGKYVNVFLCGKESC